MELYKVYECASAAAASAAQPPTAHYPPIPHRPTTPPIKSPVPASRGRKLTTSIPSQVLNGRRQHAGRTGAVRRRREMFAENKFIVNFAGTKQSAAWRRTASYKFAWCGQVGQYCVCVWGGGGCQLVGGFGSCFQR